MSDNEDHSEENGYVSNEENEENEENSEVNSAVNSDDEEGEEEEGGENVEMEDENEEDSQDESSDEDSESRHGLKRSGGKSSARSKRLALHNLVDSEAHESSDDDEEYSMDRNLDEEKKEEEKYRKIYSQSAKHSFTAAVEDIARRVEPDESPIRRHKKIQREPLHVEDHAMDEETKQQNRRAIQQDAIEIYNTTRVLPTVTDPLIYSVRVKRGSEMLAVLSLTNKYLYYEERRYDGRSAVNETNIFSAFWTGQEGLVYIEAYVESIVREVVSGMDVFLSGYRNAFQLIPVTDRTQLFEIPQQNKPILLNDFVRVKKGPYRGDVGQVIRLFEDTQQVVLKLVPRIDMSEYEGGSYSAANVRPEARLFDPNKFPEGKVNRRNYAKFGGLFFEYKGSYYRDGLLYKEYAIKDIQRDVVVTKEEKERFQQKKSIDPADIYNPDFSDGEHAHEEEAESEKRQKNIKYFFKDDRVRIINGELKNLVGVVEDADSNRHQVHIRVSVGDDYETLLLNESELMKVFKVGDHVKVLDGVYTGETGLVVLADDGSTGDCVVLSDAGDREMRVFVNYLVVSAEVSRGIISVQGFDIYDLVAIPGGKVGIVVQLSPQRITVIDQQGKIRSFDFHLIRAKKNNVSHNSNLLDVRQNQVHENDAVLIVEGDYKGRTGVVKRIWRNYVYVKCASITEYNGVVLVRNRQIELDVENQPKKRMDSKDAIESQRRKPGEVDWSSTKRGSRDKRDNLKDGVNVIVKEGRFKGLRGYVFDSNDTDVKIMLHSRPQPITVPRSMVMLADMLNGDNTEMSMPHASMMHPVQRSMPPPQIYREPPPPSWNTFSQRPPLPPAQFSGPVEEASSRGFAEPEGDKEPIQAREPWRLVGVHVRTSDGRNGVLMRCDGDDGNEVMLDDQQRVQMPTASLNPVMAFNADQEVVVIDDPESPQRAVMVKVDGEDLVVKVDGVMKLVKTAVVVDPKVYSESN